MSSGCSSSDESDGSSKQNTGPQGSDPYTVDFAINDVPPGFEGTKCRKVRLGNTSPIAISRIVNDISSSSHHFVVSTLDADTPEAQEEQLEPIDCEPFRAPLLGSPLAITQKHHDAYSLPAGVGYAMTPHQMIHLELHYINTGTEPTNIQATSQLFPLGEGELVNEASVMVVGNLNVQIPPLSDHSVGPTFQDVPEQYDGVSIYAMTGHTHRYGTNVQVSTVEAPEGAETPRYNLDHFVWDSPEVVSFDPPFQVSPSGGFSYTCSWHNPTPEMVTFGESANAEMCFFWVYYYPAVEGRALLLAR